MIDYVSGVPLLESGKTYTSTNKYPRRTATKTTSVRATTTTGTPIAEKEEPNAKIVELLNNGCGTAEHNSFNQTILWS